MSPGSSVIHKGRRFRAQTREKQHSGPPAPLSRLGNRPWYLWGTQAPRKVSLLSPTDLLPSGPKLKMGPPDAWFPLGCCNNHMREHSLPKTPARVPRVTVTRADLLIHLSWWRQDWLRAKIPEDPPAQNPRLLRCHKYPLCQAFCRTSKSGKKYLCP